METLGNYLGVMIGFVTVMLVLSLFVTGAGGGLSVMLGLRWRSGHATIVRFMVQQFETSVEEARVCADKVYNLPAWEVRSPGRFRRWWNRLIGARAPLEIGWSDILPILQEHLDKTGAAKERPAEWKKAQLERLRGRLSDEYARSMKALSFVLSFAVAFAFQVSATKLVSDLATSDTMRAKALELSEKLVKEPPAAAVTAFSARAEKALEELQKALPSITGALEEMSGLSDSREELVAELTLILKGHKDQTRAIEAFNTILDRGEKASTDRTIAEARGAKISLTALDIRFLDDLCFYRRMAGCPGVAVKDPKAPKDAKAPDPERLLWTNIVGVLMTGILLTLGAPFWYERLRDLKVFQNQLRDAIKSEPIPPQTDSAGAAAPPPPPPQ